MRASDLQVSRAQAFRRRVADVVLAGTVASGLRIIRKLDCTGLPAKPPRSWYVGLAEKWWFGSPGKVHPAVSRPTHPSGQGNPKSPLRRLLLQIKTAVSRDILAGVDQALQQGIDVDDFLRP
jgi:hypothetical protein